MKTTPKETQYNGRGSRKAVELQVQSIDFLRRLYGILHTENEPGFESPKMSASMAAGWIERHLAPLPDSRVVTAIRSAAIDTEPPPTPFASANQFIVRVKLTESDPRAVLLGPKYQFRDGYWVRTRAGEYELDTLAEADRVNRILGALPVGDGGGQNAN